MEMGVRWVYQAVRGPSKMKVEAGQKPSLCFKGREHMLCVAAAHPVRVFKRPVRDFLVLRRVTRADGSEYTVLDAAHQLQEIGRRNGITIGAAKLLECALNDGVQIDESRFNDEEEMTTMETVPSEGTTEGAPAAVPEETSNEAGEQKDTPVRKAKPAKAKAKPARTKETKAKETKAAPKKTATKKADKPKKAAAGPKGPSRISQAVDWMRAYIKKKGGQDKLARGDLKDMYAEGAKMFDLSTITMSIQYNKQVRVK